MDNKYHYLSQLDCFNDLKVNVPYLLDELESNMKWYEEEATDDDMEYLNSFLICVYCDGNIKDWLREVVAYDRFQMATH